MSFIRWCFLHMLKLSSLCIPCHGSFDEQNSRSDVFRFWRLHSQERYFFALKHWRRKSAYISWSSIFWILFFSRTGSKMIFYFFICISDHFGCNWSLIGLTSLFFYLLKTRLLILNETRVNGSGFFSQHFLGTLVE